MNPQPKKRPIRDKKYLAWIRTLPCGGCVVDGWSGQDVIQAHHVRRQIWGAGIGIRPHDLVAVPRCKYHHDNLFEDNVELEIIDLLLEYFGRKK